MDKGLFFIIGFLFTFLILASDNQDNCNSFNKNSFQTVIQKNNSDCIIPSFSFDIKPVLQKVNSFHLYAERNNFFVLVRKETQLESFLKIYRQRKFSSKNLNKIPIRLILYSSTDKPDSHNLV